MRQALRLVDDQHGRLAGSTPRASARPRARAAARLRLRALGRSARSATRASRRTRRGSASGCCRCTQCTRAGCRSSAARISVVLPVPASPTSRVMPVRLAMPYSRLLSASRCASSAPETAGSASGRTDARGSRRRPRTSAHPLSQHPATRSAPPRSPRPRAASGDRRRRGKQQLAPPRGAPLARRGHHRDDREHRQRQRDTTSSSLLKLVSRYSRNATSARPSARPPSTPIRLIAGGPG